MEYTRMKSFASPAARKTGRPYGTLPTKVETVAEFVTLAITQPLAPPPQVPKSPKPPGSGRGIWKHMTPEERSAYAKKLATYRHPRNMVRTGPRKIPKGWTAGTTEAAKARALLEAEKLVTKLIKRGEIDSRDKAGIAATIDALVAVRSPGGRTAKARKARQLLRHYHPELAATL